MSEHAYRTKGVIGYVGREDANGVRSGIRLEGGNGEGNGVGGGNGDVMGKGKERERDRWWSPTKERKVGTRTEDEGHDRGE